MEIIERADAGSRRSDPWNKNKLIGQKPPLQPKHVWTIRSRLMIEGNKRDSRSVQSCHRQQTEGL
jgi:hypothetical protein